MTADVGFASDDKSKPERSAIGVPSSPGLYSQLDNWCHDDL